jgi:hypothetical protein
MTFLPADLGSSPDVSRLYSRGLRRQEVAVSEFMHDAPMTL